MFYRKLTYPAVIFSVIKPMVLKKSELTLPGKMKNTQFRQRKTILTRGIVIIGCIKERHLVECFFNTIKAFRRVATRYDKLASSFLAFVRVASIWLLSK